MTLILTSASRQGRATDDAGLTALDHGWQRLAKLGPGRDRVTKSKSLDGNLVFCDEEMEFIELIREAGGERADEFVVYVQKRRKAALRQFMPRRELRIIVERLESLQV